MHKKLPYKGAVEGFIHSVETGGMVDGPGIRYVVFFSGCTLRCQYCHNPDTWNMRDGQRFTVEETIRDIKKYKSYLKFSGGGVTIGGGEPLVQPDFLVQLLKACKYEGLHTAVDTSGYAPPDVSDRVLAYTDMLLLDFKAFHPKTYKRVTGVPLERTLGTLEIARARNIPTWIRFVLVPGLTDHEGDLQAMAKYLEDYPNVVKVEILPFHKMGEYKWEELGLPYTLKDVEPPTKAQVARVRQIFEKFQQND